MDPFRLAGLYQQMNQSVASAGDRSQTIATIDPGFRRDHVLIVNADIANTQTPADLRSALFAQSLERLRAVPAVLAAGGALITPVSGSGWNDRVKADGYVPASDKEAMSWANAVTDGYFAALGVRRIAGRDFDATDTLETRRASPSWTSRWRRSTSVRSTPSASAFRSAKETADRSSK